MNKNPNVWWWSIAKLYVALWAVSALVSITFVAAVLYAIVHFVVKFW